MRLVDIAWVEYLGSDWAGKQFAISTERHDGIVYMADSVQDAIKKYEADRNCKVETILSVYDLKKDIRKAFTRIA